MKPHEIYARIDELLAKRDEIQDELHGLRAMLGRGRRKKPRITNQLDDPNAEWKFTGGLTAAEKELHAAWIERSKQQVAPEPPPMPAKKEKPLTKAQMIAEASQNHAAHMATLNADKPPWADNPAYGVKQADGTWEFPGGKL